MFDTLCRTRHIVYDGGWNGDIGHRIMGSILMGGIGDDMAGHPAIYQENQAVPDGEVARCTENYIPRWLLPDWQ